jgi:hypothetical protein
MTKYHNKETSHLVKWTVKYEIMCESTVNQNIVE